MSMARLLAIGAGVECNPSRQRQNVLAILSAVVHVSHQYLYYFPSIYVVFSSDGVHRKVQYQYIAS